ncbi:hypothetical protein GCM10009624_01440 [Gordonia sinesedis]
MPKLTASHPSSPALISENAAAAAHLMLKVGSFAELVRLVSSSDEAGIDLTQFDDAVKRLADYGVGDHLVRVHEGVGRRSAEDLYSHADALLSAIADSPLPTLEWGPVSELIGDDLLASLVEISPSSLVRYRSGQRTTPDPIAQRLHTVTLIVADLRGSYNEFGIRRWFTRPRTTLGGVAPADILTGDWSPDSPEVHQVRRLAAALLGASLG